MALNRWQASGNAHSDNFSWGSSVFEQCTPGLQLGHYPQRNSRDGDRFDRALETTAAWLQRQLPQTRRPIRRLLKRIERHGNELRQWTDPELQQLARSLKTRLRNRHTPASAVAEAFALVRETAERHIGKRHYDEQLIAGWTMLQGRLAEMETGEGKTLAATLPACTAALAGVPVHVVTVNDYLVKRDAETMRPIYEFLGLSVGSITADMDEDARRCAWACDIVYCSNKQLAFDYLRDRIILRRVPGKLAHQVEALHNPNPVSRRLLMRGLCFAIVDEADSVLIDEAVTPLVISQPGKVDPRLAQRCSKALEIANGLVEERDFVTDDRNRQVHLTDSGKQRVEQSVQGDPDRQHPGRREALLVQALLATHLFQRDRDYLVRDGRIEIIDDFTGRTLADRNWEQGLHQMIELREGCDISAPCETLARISYQQFFGRYLHLAGMTGTAQEAGAELQSIYRLAITRIPTHRPSRLVAGKPRIFTTTRQQWRAVVERVRELHAQQRPVLIGTRSVADSEYISSLLKDARLAQRVLNARQDHDEADVIAGAGQAGAITIATNMAGRGTDIPLGPGVAENGGLHVIAVSLNEARRIDRQLFGRSARQGAPGSYEAMVSLEDDLFTRYLPKCFQFLAAKQLKGAGPLARWRSKLLITICQSRCEHRQQQVRQDLANMEEQLGRMLAFSGQQE